MHNTIKTFEDACRALNIEPAALPGVDTLPDKHKKAIEAHYKLVIIAEALNEGWQPDWSDWEQNKWYPWLKVKTTEDKPSGVGFSYSCTRYGYTLATVGSRLCFKTRELARYAAEQFADLYKDYFLFD